MSEPKWTQVYWHTAADGMVGAFNAEPRANRKLINLIAAVEAALTEMRPAENGFPRNVHCARSRLREALEQARKP